MNFATLKVPAKHVWKTSIQFVSRDFSLPLPTHVHIYFAFTILPRDKLIAKKKRCQNWGKKANTEVRCIMQRQKRAAWECETKRRKKKDDKREKKRIFINYDFFFLLFLLSLWFKRNCFDLLMYCWWLKNIVECELKILRVVKANFHILAIFPFFYQFFFCSCFFKRKWNIFFASLRKTKTKRKKEKNFVNRSFFSFVLSFSFIKVAREKKKSFCFTEYKYRCKNELLQIIIFREWEAWRKDIEMVKISYWYKCATTLWISCINFVWDL